MSNKILFGLNDQTNRATMALTGGEPVLLYGPAGSGKTIMAQKVANAYKETIKENSGLDIPIVYLQLYPEMTKGTLIGGETLIDGSIVVKPQIVTTAGAAGAIFIIDECTHTTEPVLLSFNSLIEEPNSTVIGKEVFRMSQFTRFLFAGNHPDHTGNIELPTSFANRLYIEEVGYPEEAHFISIATHYTGIDKNIAKFIAEIITKARDESLPISPRNMLAASRAVLRLEKTGYKKPSGTLRLTASTNNILTVLKKKDIHPEFFKEVLLSTLGAKIKTHSTVPDKIQALLW